MIELQPHVMDQDAASQEYEYGGSDVVINLSRSQERGSADTPWLAFTAAYVDAEGKPGSLEREIHEHCFEQIGKFTEIPAPLPEVDTTLMSEKEKAIRQLKERANKAARENAETGEAARLYARGVLGESLRVIDSDTAKQIVAELVVAAIQAHEAKKQSKQ